jgi:exonuclease VII large subunit
MEGKVVEAFGFLHAKKGLRSTALQVSRLRLASDVSPVQVAEDKALRAIFGKANAGVDAFPTGELLISYIHGRASAVTADFLGQLRRIPAHFLDPIEVNLREPGSIREGVERARGSVVCLLRGGGADADFEVFNHPDLLDAWRDKAAFKITALGHTQNTTLLDRFSHKVSKTPTEAGTWIIDQIEDQINRQHWQQQAQEAGAAAQKAAEDAAQRLEALHRQYQASLDAVKEETARKEEQIRTASQRLTEEAIRKQEALQSQVATSQAREAAKTREIEILRGMRRGPLPRWVWPVIVAAAWLGLLVGWLFTR